MRKWSWALLLIGAGGAAVGLAWRAASPAAEAVAGDARERVVRRDLEQAVKATGVVKPRVGAEVRVGSRVSGVVHRLYVQVGDRVEKGQLLAELDDRELEARHQEAVANLTAARAEAIFAAAELGRKREVRTAGVLSANDLDASERAHAFAAARVRESESRLATATTQLGYARIEAPIRGVVASVATQEGETVAASFAAPTFLTLLDLERLEVRAYVDETDIGRIALHQEARFTVDTYGDEEFAGQVSAIYPQAEIRDNVVDYVTVVTFEAPRERLLRPEMTATVRIVIALRKAVLTLPHAAVHRDGVRAFVMVGDDGARERRWIVTGARDERGWEVVEGLREGEEVHVGDPIGG